MAKRLLLPDVRSLVQNKRLEAGMMRMQAAASDYLHNPDKAKGLVIAGQNQLTELQLAAGPVREAVDYMGAMLRLLRAYVRQEYTAIPWSSMLFITGAVVYFVALADIIPDVILGVGLLDDMAVIGLVAAQVAADLDRFRLWESEPRTRSDPSAQ